MTTVNWTISTLDRDVATGFVNVAHWQASAVDGEYSASTYSTSSWADGTPTTPYANLIQATVLGWIWTNGVDKEAVEASLQAQIDAQKNPVTATGVPW
jgi:hypothetical protein